jgi:hypothetical protein
VLFLRRLSPFISVVDAASKVEPHDRYLVPSLIEGLRVVQGLRVVPVFLYRYSMIN